MKLRLPTMTACAAILLILWSGCGKNTHTKEKAGASGDAARNAQIEYDGTFPKDTARHEPNKDGGSNKTDYAQIGFDLEKTDYIGFLKIGMAADTVAKKLGDPEEKGPATEWGADGLEHQTWNYKSKGIEFDMVKDTARQEIDMITVTHPCDFGTKRGIKIGSTRDEVLKAYRREIDPKDTVGIAAHVVAGTIYGGIIFDFENEKVSSIYIGAAAE